MEDLFRFLLLRPADTAPPAEVATLQPTFLRGTESPGELRRAAQQFLRKSLITDASELKYMAVASGVAQMIATKAAEAKDVSAAVHKATGQTAQELASGDEFISEKARLTDCLAAMKLLSDSSGGDAPGLARLLHGYDAIARAASGVDPIGLRVLSIEAPFPKREEPEQRPEPDRSERPADHDDEKRKAEDARKILEGLEAAIATLRTVPAAGFTTARVGREGSRSDAMRIDSRLAAAGGSSPGGAASSDVRQARDRAGGTGRGDDSQPWMLSAETIELLPDSVLGTIRNAGIDLGTQPLPVVLNALDKKHTEQLAATESAAQDTVVHRIGKHFSDLVSDDYVGTPAAPLPTTRGTVRPVGIGDLLLVKQHVLRYQGGDLAHVENVLKSEHLARDTRRLQRSETTILQETETTKEEERDTQTTDRFSLKRETSDTIKTDSSFKAGISVDAKYGPFVEVKANADYATSTSTESSTKQASEFSKDVVARSASKLVERILERRTVTTIEEFEEKYSHGFDNTDGDGHISGYYQWIDKVSQHQVYNYGKRLLFDVTLPEPATNYILAQTNAADSANDLVRPAPFTLPANQLTEANYITWAQKYDVTGLEPPPAPWKTVSKAIDATVNANPHESSKSENLAIDDGYRAKYAYLQRSYLWVDSDTGVNVGPHWHLIVGSNWIDGFGSVGYVDMSDEVGTVAFSMIAYKVELLAASIEIFCERTERAVAAWQLKTHAAITQGYLAKLQTYEQKLAQATAAAGTVISGRNPAFNTELVAAELRKQCLTLVTAQHFNAFGALELSSEGYAQPNLARTAAQMPYVRFFEQAFEWEHLIYFFYPYFWGLKKAWEKRMLLDDVDPAFGDFLRAGSVRVVFPVRPGFEAAVIHYLETGELWNGGPPPDIASPLYVPIIKEIQEATGAPGDEKPVGDPWLVVLPTTLVHLRPNNDLPQWNKVGEDWQPTN